MDDLANRFDAAQKRVKALSKALETMICSSCMHSKGRRFPTSTPTQREELRIAFEAMRLEFAPQR